MGTFLLAILVFGCIFILILDGGSSSRTSVVTKTPMRDHEILSAYREMQGYTKLQLENVKFAGEKVIMEGKVVEIDKSFDGDRSTYNFKKYRYDKECYKVNVEVKVRDMLVKWTSPYWEEYSNYNQNSAIRFEGTIETSQCRGVLRLKAVSIKV